MKKTVIILLITALLTSALSLFVSAEATYGVCGDGLTWQFDEASGTLTITGSGDMYDYSAYYSQIHGRDISTAPWGLYYESIRNALLSP
ncbi:MAG: hypothetical protein IKN38_03405, partial [Clostridia bacterium]|nr:hypothetical protein [Clostridia bacterium]